MKIKVLCLIGIMMSFMAKANCIEFIRALIEFADAYEHYSANDPSPNAQDMFKKQDCALSEQNYFTQEWVLSVTPQDNKYHSSYDLDALYKKALSQCKIFSYQQKDRIYDDMISFYGENALPGGKRIEKKMTETLSSVPKDFWEKSFLGQFLQIRHCLSWNQRDVFMPLLKGEGGRYELQIIENMCDDIEAYIMECGVENDLRKLNIELLYDTAPILLCICLILHFEELVKQWHWGQGASAESVIQTYHKKLMLDDLLQKKIPVFSDLNTAGTMPEIKDCLSCIVKKYAPELIFSD